MTDLLYVGSDIETVERLAADGRAFEVTVVTTTESALARLGDGDYDCLLCDAGTVSALESFLATVAEGPDRHELPVVVRGDGESVAAGGANVVAVDAERLDPADLRAAAAEATPEERALTDGSTGDHADGDGESDRSVDRSGRTFEADGPVEPGRFSDPVLDGLPDPVFVVGPDGTPVRWNRRVAEATRDVDDEGRPRLSALFVDDGAEFERLLADLREDGDETTRELSLLTGEGESVPHEFTASFVGEGDGQYVSVVGRDITEHRRTEEKLDDAIVELERSNAELEQFAYVASHDMKEPLRMVSSYLELLERRYGDELDEDAEEFIRFAVEGAERMREMINGLLAYSRVGRQGKSFEPVDVDDALATATENLAITIEESDAEIVAEELPTVEGDASQLAQLFQNLVGNAIKYSGDADPRIEIGAERRAVGESEDGNEWMISVSDNGIGIPDDRVDAVFDIFTQGGSDSGSGIGLAICEKIVEHHDGDIWVSSVEGEGTTFYFTLPAPD